MKTIILFLLIVSLFVLMYSIAPTLSNPTGFAIIEEQKNDSDETLPVFRIYTKALCKNVSNLVVCHDELFANCGNLEYLIPRSDIEGNGIFDKDWKDPRFE